MFAGIEIALGAGAGVGRLLDVERALARAHRHLACLRICRSRVESARSALLRSHRIVLARSPVLQHLSRLLHGGVSPALADSVGTLRRASGSNYDWMFRVLSAAGLGAAVDAGGAAGWPGDRRLCMGYLALRRAALRRAFTLPFTRWASRLCADTTHRSLLCVECRRRSRF